MSGAVMADGLSSVLNLTHSGQSTGLFSLFTAASPEVLTRKGGDSNYSMAMSWFSAAIAAGILVTVITGTFCEDPESWEQYWFKKYILMKQRFFFLLVLSKNIGLPQTSRGLLLSVILNFLKHIKPRLLSFLALLWCQLLAHGDHQESSVFCRAPCFLSVPLISTNVTASLNSAPQSHRATAACLQSAYVYVCGNMHTQPHRHISIPPPHKHSDELAA